MKKLLMFICLIVMLSCTDNMKRVHPSTFVKHSEIVRIVPVGKSLEVTYWDMRDTTRHKVYVDIKYNSQLKLYNHGE